MRILVLAAALAVAACGVRSRPLPPEVVQPDPPTDLVAKSSPEGVRLTWRRPTSYSGGKHMRDLAGFEIERATAPDFDYAKVGTVTLTDQTRFQQERSATLTDDTAVVGTTYRYRVVATTTDGYRSVPSEPVTIEHRPGTTATAPPPPPRKPRPKYHRDRER
jgi:hypothetical protein